jgi:pimeloyl-ACP methyl ester carboxylesterase
LRDQPIEELRAHPPAELAGLGVAEIVAHYERIVRAYDEPPVLIGHSFGGLFTQILLDRGLGAAGVALDPAPPAGVLPLEPSVLRANAHVLLTPGGWRKVLRMSFSDFQYGFVNTMPLAEQRAAYDEHVVPETGRVFFQAALAPVEPNHVTRVNFSNATRAPLLLVAGLSDHIVTPGIVRATYRKYQATPAVAARTDLREFPNRCHWLLAQDGWEEVAAAIERWLAERAVV